MLTPAATAGLAANRAIPRVSPRMRATRLYAAPMLALNSALRTIPAVLLTLAPIGPAAAATSSSMPVGATHAAVAADEFPDEWFWRIGDAGPKHRAMTGKAPPKLDLRGWVGKADEIDPLKKGDLFETLKGKVIVVDFWATWCGPCRKALPENVAMIKELGDQGLVVIGVHDAARGSETMEKVAGAAGVQYPLAIDNGGKSAKAWNVGFWPTYGVIDRKGTLRAIGLQPQHVRAVAEKLLAEKVPVDGGEASPASKPEKKKSPSLAKPAVDAEKPPAAARVEPLPRAMLEGDGRRRGQVAKFDQCPEAPELAFVTQWTNTAATMGSAATLKELRGKVVVLDFWATWCGPCIASIPKANELARKYADQGLVIIGVCRPDGGEKMLDLVRGKGIEYPVCIDSKGEVNAAYAVDSFPDYYLIDRNGRLRGADVASASLEDAIKLLLAEARTDDAAAATADTGVDETSKSTSTAKSPTKSTSKSTSK